MGLFGRKKGFPDDWAKELQKDMKAGHSVYWDPNVPYIPWDKKSKKQNEEMLSKMGEYDGPELRADDPSSFGDRIYGWQPGAPPLIFGSPHDSHRSSKRSRRDDFPGPEFPPPPGPSGRAGISRHDWTDMPGEQPRRHQPGHRPRGSSKHPYGSILSPNGKHSVPKGPPHPLSQMQHPSRGPSEHFSQRFSQRQPSFNQQIPSQQYPDQPFPSLHSIAQQGFPAHHSLPTRFPPHSNLSNLSMQAQPAHTVQLPLRPGKIREGERLPTDMVDPMATVSNHEFGHHGLRAHVPGMTKLEVQGSGGPDDPRGDWGLLEDIQRLNLGGGGSKRTR